MICNIATPARGLPPRHLHAPYSGDDLILTAEQLAQVIIQSIDRHGLRGLIYEADGMTDVVMHGKVDMVEVAKDILEAIATP